eukprot:TRINITY_DN3352_c0_g1_i1.p1 TRINITY_DN3352_c0_g1~~TRINITY_DN3352_c0_g1_i1.p1  ORF type:complete len:106 (-),score=35.24 TRINITY_DN3352_c0_g1_i1:106-423(-)
MSLVVETSIVDTEDVDAVRQFVETNSQELNELIVIYVWEGTLLHWACYYGRRNVVEYLLTLENINVDVKLIAPNEFDGLTAKQTAEKRGYEEIVKLFNDRESKPI